MDKEEGDAKKHELKLRMRLEALIFYLASLTIRAEVVDYGEFFFLSDQEKTPFLNQRETRKSRKLATTKALRQRLLPLLITIQPLGCETKSLTSRFYRQVSLHISFECIRLKLHNAHGTWSEKKEANDLFIQGAVPINFQYQEDILFSQQEDSLVNIPWNSCFKYLPIFGIEKWAKVSSSSSSS